MKKGLTFSAVFAGVTGMAVYPLLAQDEGGIRATLDLSQRLEQASNLGLDVPDEGDTTLSTTSLTFNLTSETKSQSLSVSAGGLIRAGSVPASNDSSTGFSDPRISLAYSREALNSKWDVDANVRQSEISFLRPLTDFVDDAGNLTLPQDFENLNGAGTRTNFSFATSLETGLNNAVGFVFDAAVRGIDYSNTPSTSLFDTLRTSFGTTAILRFNPITTGNVRAGYDRFTEEDPEDTDRKTYSLGFSLETAVSKTTALTTGVGYEIIETEENGITNTEEGLTGQVAVTHEMTNGTASVSLVSSRDQAGDRLTFNVGRSLELPRGAFSASVGATSSNGGSPSMVGDLAWQHQMRSSATSLRIGRSVSTNSNDEERIATSINFDYNHEINNLSGIGLNFNFGLVEGSASTNRVESSSLSVTYRRAITEDWNLQTGISHRIRDEQTVGTANSTSVFVGLSRSFVLIP